MRSAAFSSRYFSDKRAKWDIDLDRAVKALNSNKNVGRYIKSIKKIVGLDNSVLDSEELWNVLREPFAGELIIPRKLRVGHRIHINEFAYIPSGRQVRLSSNFFSYSNCNAINLDESLDRKKSVELIGAFLLSSFGQLQFEIESFNREGARSMEQHQLKKIRIFDPRWINVHRRDQILEVFSRLPYPIATDRPAYLQKELVELDELFAAEIVNKIPGLNESALLTEVHQLLFEWIEIRKP